MRCGIQGGFALGVPVQTPLAGFYGSTAEGADVAKSACAHAARTKFYLLNIRNLPLVAEPAN